MSEIALEAWGEHEALLLKPPRSPPSIPPPPTYSCVCIPLGRYGAVVATTEVGVRPPSAV